MIIAFFNSLFLVNINVQAISLEKNKFREKCLFISRHLTCFIDLVGLFMTKENEVCVGDLHNHALI